MKSICKNNFQIPFDSSCSENVLQLTCVQGKFISIPIQVTLASGFELQETLNKKSASFISYFILVLLKCECINSKPSQLVLSPLLLLLLLHYYHDFIHHYHHKIFMDDYILWKRFSTTIFRRNQTLLSLSNYGLYFFTSECDVLRVLFLFNICIIWCSFTH